MVEGDGVELIRVRAVARGRATARGRGRATARDGARVALGWHAIKASITLPPRKRRIRPRMRTHASSSAVAPWVRVMGLELGVRAGVGAGVGVSRR